MVFSEGGETEDGGEADDDSVYIKCPLKAYVKDTRLKTEQNLDFDKPRDTLK